MKTNRNLWPLGIFVTFGLFFAGMASVVVIAATHRDSMVNANYYEQELKFQGQIDATTRAQKSGATIVSGNHAVTVTLPDASSPKLSGMVEFYRPSAPELDRTFPLALKADGTQTLDVSRFAAGLWRVRVKWNADGQDYFLEQKITVTGK
jgi:nitrogen fixation protein FixH